MQRLWRRISAIFQWKTGSEETPQEKPEDNSNLKSVRGIVTYLCTDYGWINESIFFNTDMLCGNVPLNIGTSVIALVEENETTHIQKAIKVKTVTNPVDGTEQSDLDRELCIKCVSSVTQDSIYIDKETSFPVHLFSGGKIYSFKSKEQECGKCP
ncbi:cancer/testis antigen 55-like [Peromyscus eremicus]|uniref:cancer/testis antigen 55-like n=1 Tax=Peromyscus eremicus TaxID=42410 RepID=UPI0027DDE474|nr:cancer/testis antigen 55-like [Peromyscus eremicus]